MDVFAYASRIDADEASLCARLARPATQARLTSLLNAGSDPRRRLRSLIAAAELSSRVQTASPGVVLLQEELRWQQAPPGLGESGPRAALRGYFRSRHLRLAGDCARGRGEAAPRRVAISGASGLLGSALVERLRADGHEVLRLVRQAPTGPDEIRWDPRVGVVEPEALAGCAALVHLAGANVAEGRWTAARKALIRESRVEGTRALAASLAGMDRPPPLFLAASATGYYGDGGAALLDESAAPGEDWLAGVARDWEAACAPARDAGLRVVNLRIGTVLSGQGGALPRLLPLFRMGLGGPLGSGRQFMSWIALDDLLDIIGAVLASQELVGPLNAVSPESLSNRDFARCLGRVLGRPARLPVPAFALRLALGEMSQSLLLAGARAWPARLESLGFPFRLRDLESALRLELLRWQRPLPGEVSEA